MRDAFDEFTTHPPVGRVGANTPVEGFRGVFSQLVAEHRQALRLVERIVHAPRDQRAALWLELRSALYVHEYGERQYLYPALASYPSMQLMIEEQNKQAEQLETAMRHLDSIELGDDDWTAAVNRIRALVNQHFAAAELELYPRAQDLLGRDKSEQLRRHYVAVKGSLG